MDGEDLQTFIASDVPGSSSNLYSVSGFKVHSLVSAAFLSDIIKFWDSRKRMPKVPDSIPAHKIYSFSSGFKRSNV